MNNDRWQAETHTGNGVSNKSNETVALLAGIGVGAALMYLLDPDRGKRRRHLIADQAASAARTVQRSAGRTAENARNHARGLGAHLRGRFENEAVTDEQLVARVRSELGRYVERVREIEVVADGGTVTLRGPISSAELSSAIGAVSHVRGVNHVDNQLAVDDGASGLPSPHG